MATLRPIPSSQFGSIEPIHSTKAIELVRPMRGSNRPVLVRCDDGKYYVLKSAHHSRHGHVLANELFAVQLAKLIGLPVCDAAIVKVPFEVEATTFEGNPSAPPKRDARATNLQFGSRYPGEPGKVLVVEFLPDRLLRRVSNLAGAFLGGLVFDLWTCNCGRREALFIRSATEENFDYSARLIDNDACFNDGNWGRPLAPLARTYDRRGVYDGIRGPDSFEPYLSCIENVNPTQIEKCAQNIPQEWCGGNPRATLDLAECLYECRTRVRQAVLSFCSVRTYSTSQMLLKFFTCAADKYS
jgi:HipA-like kinase